MGRRTRVVPTENLFIPLSLVEANLGFPLLENGLFSLDNSTLPSYIVPKIGVTVLFIVQVVVSLGELLSLFHLSCDMGNLGYDLLGFGRAFNMRRHRFLWDAKENAAHL